MVAITSIMAFRELEASGRAGQVKGQILWHMISRPEGRTRRQIGKALAMELGTVGGGVNPLVKAHLLTEHEMVKDPTTGRTVKLVKPVTEVQGELF